VNGGIAKYQEAFLMKDKTNYPQPLREKLRDALHKQLDIIDKGLKLHSRLCSPDMRGLQDKLEGMQV
jgi:hypothetical protein